MSANPSKERVLVAKIICAEVKRRGGRVQIPLGDIPPLLRMQWKVTAHDSYAELTLESLEAIRDLDQYENPFLYYLDVALKYLIASSPGQRFFVTGKDLATSVFKFTFEAVPDDSLIVFVDPPHGVMGPKDRMFQATDERIVVVDGTPLSPDEKPN